MRMLHTSDWHLGRSLHGADLRAAQEAFVQGLVDTVRSEKVDVVLVAGDVYDRAVPPVDAVDLCASAFLRLRQAGAKVVIISGNHDSARRLGFGAELVDSSGVFLRTRVQRCAEPIVLDGVSFFALPYLEPEAVRSQLPHLPDAPEPKGHHGVLSHALTCARTAQATPQAVVLAHAWVTGGVASDSERDITVGGVGAVPSSLFDGFTYTALGHLHGPQTLADGLRYSGSPLPYSFSEAGHTKGSWLVELTDAGLGAVEQVPSPTPYRLSTLRGRLDDLLRDPNLKAQEGDFLSVVLTDPGRPEAPMDRLSLRFKHILVLAYEPEGVVRDDQTYASRVAQRSDVEVAGAFVEHVRGTAPEPFETALLNDAFEAGRRAPV